MSVLEILDTLLFKPLQLLFEMIYIMTNKMIDNPGLSIIVLSLAMNFLVLPLYRRADKMQEEERDMEAKLQKGVTHIKKTFRGDERMMMLQTYYRQNGYKPTYVLRGAASLLLEIPFFIAAYRFLSGLQLLEGVAFGPIADLGKQDGMLLIAGTPVNVLPIIMTGINLVTCVIFTKGGTFKSKIQLYAMAVFFLVFLYSSPAGLVFYWTLNNVFSLVKTIFYKLKKPGKVLEVIISIIGIGVLIYGLFIYEVPTLKRKLFFAGSGIFLQMPLVYSAIEKNLHFHHKSKSTNVNKKVFIMGEIFLAVLTGALIPSTVIQASPQEFMDVNYFYHPLWLVVSSLSLAVGTFVIWLGVFYWLSKPAVRAWFDRIVWILVGVALVNYMFFGKNLGLLTPRLKYERGMNFTVAEQLGNLAILLIIAGILYVIYRRWEKKTPGILFVAILALAVMSTVNVFKINNSINSVKQQIENGQELDNGEHNFTLSKTGKNVIVLMLDRGMGEYIPYLFNEKPELKEQFSGFTYYSNVISFGHSTNIALPALCGGYEYTPQEINKRDGESLASKHNEALKVMPVLFAQNGFDVTVSDPTYANYQLIPDCSIYDEHAGIQSFNMRGMFIDDQIKEKWIQGNKRNFFCYGVLQTIPLCIRNIIYGYGDYNQGGDETFYSEQKVSGYTSIGFSMSFMDAYNVLDNLSNITEVTNDEKNTFLLMTNDATHDTMMLQEPDYTPTGYVDNTDFETNNQERFTLGESTLRMEEEIQYTHYQSNMAALLQLGKWFDYMREQGIYDNTRIIVVSDHGIALEHLEELLLEDGTDVSQFYPLLLVKDFDSKEFTTSEEFMTNGDVPALAVKDIIDKPVNPFTGKKIDSKEKIAHPQYVIANGEGEININNGNTFLPATWFSVQDDIWNKYNWSVVAKEAVYPIEYEGEN